MIQASEYREEDAIKQGIDTKHIPGDAYRNGYLCQDNNQNTYWLPKSDFDNKCMLIKGDILNIKKEYISTIIKKYNIFKYKEPRIISYCLMFIMRWCKYGFNNKEQELF